MKIQLDTDNTPDTFDKSNLNSDPEVQGSDEVKKMLRSGIKAAQNGNRSEARHFLLNVTEVQPENEDAWLWLASISEYPEELLIFLNNVLKINPENEKALEWAKSTKALLAKTFVERGIKASEDDQKEFAKQCFLQAIVHDDQNELAWLWLASISEVADEKNNYLQRVLRINPENESALASLKKSKTKLAKSFLEKANENVADGDIEKALDSLRESLKQAPDLEDAWILKSHLTSSLNERLECFQKVLEINPNNPIAQAGVASLKAIVGKSQHEAVKEAVKEAPAKEEIVENVAFEEVVEEKVKEKVKEKLKEAVKGKIHTQNLLDESDDNLLDLKSVEKTVQNDIKKVEVEESKESQVEEVAKEESTQVSEAADPVVHQEVVQKPNEAEVVPEENEVTVSYEEAIAQQETVTFNYSDLKAQTPEESGEVSEPVYEEDPVEDPGTFETVKAEEPMENGSSVGGQIVAPPPQIQNKPSDEFDELKQVFADEAEAIMDKIEPVHSTDNNGVVSESKPKTGMTPMVECPFCKFENEQQEFVCNYCHAMLTFSDLEMLLAHNEADRQVLELAVLEMKDARKIRELSVEELTNLGLAEINLRNLRKGFEYLQEAVQLNPNDVLLHSQVNSLAIRISEIEEQEIVHDSMPKNKTILVVDDSATVRKLITSKLEKCGHEVICAVDGKDALEKINEVIPDLILLDITMPRMDGYQVCKLIRGNDVTKDVPVVMISGKDGFFDKVRGRMAGTSGYITKPFGPETLMKTVDAYLD
jgi:CheY-like chemotaxis protein